MSSILDKKVLQTGLYSRSDKEVKQLVKRVGNFNARNLGKAINLDIIPFEEGDPEGGLDFPHYKLRFLFPNRNAQEAFWTGND